MEPRFNFGQLATQVGKNPMFNHSSGSDFISRKTIQKQSRKSITDSQSSFASSQNTKAMMDYIKTEFLSKELQEKYYKEGKHQDETLAIRWLMFATGCYRIFTTEDLKEFTFRCAVLMHHTGISTRFFNDEVLATFSKDGRKLEITLRDVLEHFGMEAGDHYENYDSRTEWLYRLKEQGCNSFGAIYFFRTGSIPGFRNNFKDLFTSEHGELRSEVLDFANALSDYALQSYHTGAYPTINETHILKIMECVNRKNTVAQIPEFDINQVPSEIIEKCLTVFENDEYAKEVMAQEEEFRTEHKALIHLAWCYANGLITVDATAGFDTPVEGCNIEFGDFVDGDLKRAYILNAFGLIIPDLKGLFFNPGVQEKL